MKLSNLNIGGKGIVSFVNSNGIPLKLFQMGCIPGVEITLIGYAPLGDPMLLSIGGTNVAILKEIADCIEIQKA